MCSFTAFQQIVESDSQFRALKAASNLCLSRLRERLLPPSLHRKLIAATVCLSERLSVSWIACSLCLMPLLGCCAIGENMITLHRSSVMFYTGSQFLFEFKICLLVYKSLHGAAPGYLREYCTRKETHSSASGLRLRSTDKCDLHVRRMKTRFGDRAFSAAGPRCWNRLPAALRTVGSIDSFKTGLKTYLFSISYPGC